MSRFTSILGADRRRMLSAVGAETVGELIASIPAGSRLERALDLPEAASELELVREAEALASANSAASLVCFAGAGSYDHFIPSVIDHILLRSEFYTAYTPYQAEVSQGTLQCIFEYQTMIARLTGLDCANASMYDGASAAAEAALMAIRATRRNRVAVSASINPRYLEVIRTYLAQGGFSMETVPWLPDGLVDYDAARGALAESAALIVQQPDFHGVVQDLRAAASLAHAAGALLISVTDPVAAAVLESPGAAGADIAVGEGQSMGVPMSFGGPFVGFMACRKELVRNMPGRIIGRTEDKAGQTGYVLTLQTREQHIRREKATSNICSNEALMALANTIYLSLAGESGFREISLQCLSKASYLEGILSALPGVRRPFAAPFYREFVLEYPVEAAAIVREAARHGYLAGVPVPSLGPRALLTSVTEKRTKAEMDGLRDAIAGICREVK